MESGRYTRVEEKSEVFTEALELFRLGHKDMVDNVLYASAARLGLLLLTLDEDLKKFVLEKHLKDVFISVEDLALAQEPREAKGNNSSQSAPSHHV